ncbi:MAG: hypothetical protein RIT27_663 [Pseudomonadota bacterium]|jgi:large-conductance mechanosensitive channel
MKLLNIGYENEELPYEISRLVGRRANLLTAVCHEILQILPSNKTKVNADYIRQAANSSEIYAKITMSWGNLVDNADEAQLDRMIIFMCIKSKEQLNKKDIQQALKKYDYKYTFLQLEYALIRLEIAYIIKKDLDNNRYHFCVPLFVKLLKEMPLEEMLELEMIEYRRRNKIAAKM